MVDLDPGTPPWARVADKRQLELSGVRRAAGIGLAVKGSHAVLSDKCGYWVLGANRETGRDRVGGGPGAA